jgi:feruloyl esterase
VSSFKTLVATILAGGAGPSSFDALAALDAWIVNGAPPDRTRPVCPYPQVARWKGPGSADDASNFECSAAH